MGTVCILGIFVADAAYRAPRLPRIGETLLGSGFALGPGGKGSNQAVAAARAGAATTFVSRIGCDPFGEMARRIWADAGVTPAVSDDHGEATGSAFIFVGDSGENAIIVAAGAAGGLGAADVEAQADAIRAADVFVTQLEQPMEAAMAGLRLAREAGVRTILNPAPAADLPEGMLALCDLVTPNESEAEGLTGISVTDDASARAAAGALIEKGAGAALVTLGGEGALYLGPEGEVRTEAVRAGEVVDTTGAGDAFNGALAAALSEGRAMEDALGFAARFAGIAVTRPGAAAAMPTRAEVDALASG